MKSLTFKHVLAIGLLMAGVAQQVQANMFRKLATKLAQCVARNPKKAIAAAGLATGFAGSYGYHKYSCPMKLYNFSPLTDYRTMNFSKDGRHIVVESNHFRIVDEHIAEQADANALKETAKLTSQHIGQTFASNVGPEILGEWGPCIMKPLVRDITMFNAKTGAKEKEVTMSLGKLPMPIEQAEWEFELSANVDNVIFKKFNSHNKNQFMLLKQSKTGTNSQAYVAIQATFLTRLNHWATSAVIYVKNSFDSFWSPQTK